MAVNKAIIIGNVGSDPQTLVLGSGHKVCRFSVATTEKAYTSSNGKNVEAKTEWHNIVAWGKLAEVVENYLSKGCHVYVEGKIRTRSYEDTAGVKRYVTEINVDNIQVLDNWKKANETSQIQSDITDAINDLPF